MRHKAAFSALYWIVSYQRRVTKGHRAGDNMIRERRIKSGRLFEADFYPVFRDGRRMPDRAPKAKRSSKEQAEYNKRQAEKKLIRLVNANFDTGDILMHITYDSSMAPQTESEARRDIQNYLRRIKQYRKREKLSELKYIYVIETQTYKTGVNAGRANWHFHIFMSGMDRDIAENMWGKGIRVNADRFQPERFGPEAAAKYISKDPQGAKRYSCSRNLKKPIMQKPRDGKIARRSVEKLAKERIDDREYWERRYKGYRFIKCYARQNEYNGHWYVSVIMYRTSADMPDWTIKEWMT